MQRALILFAHGARDAAWALPFYAVLDRVRASTQEPVELAYLEMMQPDLATTVAALVGQGVGHINVVPLFLGQGAHLRRDLPAQIDKLKMLYPAVAFHVSRAAGEAETVLDALALVCLNEIGRDPA